MGQHSLQLPSLGVFIILWSTKSQVVTLNALLYNQSLISQIIIICEWWPIFSDKKKLKWKRDFVYLEMRLQLGICGFNTGKRTNTENS